MHVVQRYTVTSISKLTFTFFVCFLLDAELHSSVSVEPEASQDAWSDV